MKKLLFLLLSGLLTQSIQADDFNVDGIAYTITDAANHTVSIGTGGIWYPAINSATIGSFTIPSTVAYNGITYSVTSIGSSAFIKCNKLSSVIIPASITSIGNSAFEGCSGLTSVTIPALVTSIGIDAFYGCLGLSSFNVDINNPSYSSNNGVLFEKAQTTLMKYPAGNVATVYTVPNTVTTIGTSAFYDCSGLTTVIIPNSVTSIESDAFDSCDSLISITIPNSVTSIGDFAFYSCGSLVSVTLSTSITSIKYRTFENCEKLTSVTIPASVTSIGNRAFYQCKGLTSVAIPASVTSIGDNAFYNCDGLSSFSVNMNNPAYSSNNGVLFDKTQTTLIQYPEGNTATAYSVSGTVATIGNYAFSGCWRLTTIAIPTSVTTIGSGAFGFCGSLTSLTIPNSITSIASETFRYSGLTSVTIPDQVTSIGNNAFENCSRMISLSIPKSVTSIGSYAFSGCSNIKTINCLSLTPPILGSSCFDGSTSVTDVYVSSDTAVLNYKANSDWFGYFPNNIIKKNQSSATSKLNENRVRVYTNQSKIIIEGASEGEIITIFDLSSKCIQTIISNGGRLELFAKTHSIYLVKTEEITFKVIL